MNRIGRVAALLIFGLTLPVFAQSGADDDLLKRGQGLILESIDVLPGESAHRRERITNG
jgi:hypothetical protein